MVGRHTNLYARAHLVFRPVFPGVVVVLFFQCMSALLDPANRKMGSTKWGLVVHTATMFSTVTIATALGLNLQSNSYIDDREFSSNIGLPPGPIGYKLLLYRNAFSIVPSFMFYLNQWLADGLLVSFAENVITRLCNAVGPSSSIVAMSFMP